MRWIAWGFRVVDGEKEQYVIGELDCKGDIISALVKARVLYGHVFIDHVQSGLSYEIDLREMVSKLVFNRHHPRRKPRQKVA